MYGMMFCFEKKKKKKNSLELLVTTSAVYLQVNTTRRHYILNAK